MAHTNLSRDEIDALKERVDLVEAIRAAGVELTPRGKNLFGLCPFHPDDKPSLSVNPKTRLWQCFGCKAGGDVLKFWELKEKLSFGASLKRLRQLAGEVPAGPSRSKPRPQNGLAGGYTRGELLGRVAELYRARFKANPAGQRYLEQRGLGSRELVEAFGVGLADGSLLSMLPEEGPMVEALTELGVLSERGQEHFQGCLVVPLEHPQLGVLGLYGRRLDEEEGPGRHRLLPGPLRGVLNGQALKASRRVVLAEGVFDVFALWLAGVRDATWLGGSTRIPPDLEALLGRLATREAVLCLDGDEAGQAGARELGERLAGQGLRCQVAEMPAGQDPNSVLCSAGPEALARLVAEARPLEAAPAAGGREDQADGFTLELEEVSYRVTLKPPFGGRLRAVLRASRGDRLHLDRLDLASLRARHETTNALMRVLEVPRADVERHMRVLLREAESWVSSHPEPAPHSALLPQEVPPMTEGEREEALAFLQAPDLVDRILADCEGLGFVGEETNKLLVYLIGVSRKLEKPLSGIIRSQSGAGKSSLTELVEQLTPPEDVQLYSRLSPTALGWMPSGHLKHKLVILEERTGGEAADYQIRTLQSRRRLTQLVTLKDPATGEMHANFRETEGPMAFLETTCDAVLNQENATRCFEIHLDESEEQTRRIQEAQRRARLPQKNDRRALAETIAGRHHRAQRLLVPLLVYIPYVCKLRFPSRWLRTRRDHERFLCLIEASAFLHQHQREQGVTEEGTGYVLADLADYRLAYRLAESVLEGTFHELSRTARDLWEVLRGWVRGQGGDLHQVLFTRRELRQVTGLMDHPLRSALAELAEMEYVQAVSGQNGKTYHYRLLVAEEAPSSAVAGLMTPAELERLLAAG